MFKQSWSVELRKKTQQTVYSRSFVEIEAEDADQAEAIALNMAEDGNFEWDEVNDEEIEASIFVEDVSANLATAGGSGAGEDEDGRAAGSEVGD